MAEFVAHLLLGTETVAVWDVACPGTCRGESNEESVSATHVVFPYRGVYVHHVGRAESVAEANQVIFLNEGEPYAVSHPVDGGDCSLSVNLSTEALLELAPTEHLRTKGAVALNRSRLRVGPDTQTLSALLRHGLNRGVTETLEAETLTVALVRSALGERTSRSPSGGPGRQKLVDRAKLVMSSDLGRRWTLAEIAAEVGGSPVYLTQMFQHVEGISLYRYQLQLRLARALDLLGDYDDLSSLALDLGFSSHSHFSVAFKQAYEQTPSAFRRLARPH